MRLTTRQRRILEALQQGESVEEAYVQWYRSGYSSFYERSLSVLADRGFVDWSDTISDAFITDAGRAALLSRKPKS